MDFDIFKHTVLLTLAGSRAYGVHGPNSDVDVKGVAIPPQKYIFGLSTFEQVDSPAHFQNPDLLSRFDTEAREAIARSKIEGSIYELRKFIRLALDANPNIMDVLFCRDEDVLMWGEGVGSSSTPIGKIIRDHRDIFVSARCVKSCSRFAFAQLKRIKTHRRWLLQPPSHKPTRAEFDLPESTLIPQSQLAAAESLVRKKLDSWEPDLSMIQPDSVRDDITGRITSSVSEMIAAITSDLSEQDAKWRAAVRAVGIDDNLLLILERERKYKSAKSDWDSYTNWQATRNKDRASDEARFGYDCKHAGHLFRLLKMAEEILLTGKVNVWRGDIDADEIRAIRSGQWTYDTVVSFAEERDRRIQELYRDKKYVIPYAPDTKRAEELCISLVRLCIENA